MVSCTDKRNDRSIFGFPACALRQFGPGLCFILEFGVPLQISEKGPGQTLAPSSGSEFGEKTWANTGPAGSELEERTRPCPGSAGLASSEKDRAEPWFGRFRNSEKATDRTLVLQVWSSEK